MTTGIIIAAVATILMFFYLMHHKDEAMAQDEQDTHTPVIVTGYWLDDGEPFTHYAIIGNEYTCPERHSGKVFWYFGDEYEIIGRHGDFFINSFTYANRENNNG